MLSKWTIEDVVNWLAEIGFGDLGHVFESNEVSGDKFANLNENVLSDELAIGNEIVSYYYFFLIHTFHKKIKML